MQTVLSLTPEFDVCMPEVRHNKEQWSYKTTVKQSLLCLDSLCTDAYKDNDEKENDQSRYNANDDYFPLFAHQPAKIQIFTSCTNVSTLASV